MVIFGMDYLALVAFWYSPPWQARHAPLRKPSNQTGKLSCQTGKASIVEK
jgi:hypothetical protein